MAISSTRQGDVLVDAELVDAELPVRPLVRRKADHAGAAHREDPAAVGEPVPARRSEVAPLEQPLEVRRRQFRRVRAENPDAHRRKGRSRRGLAGLCSAMGGQMSNEGARPGPGTIRRLFGGFRPVGTNTRWPESGEISAIPPISRHLYAIRSASRWPRSSFLIRSPSVERLMLQQLGGLRLVAAADLERPGDQVRLDLAQPIVERDGATGGACVSTTGCVVLGVLVEQDARRARTRGARCRTCRSGRCARTRSRARARCPATGSA